MKVFISADIEGINGVVGDQHSDPQGADYARACDWMVKEVNAAIEGAFDGGASYVLVKDSHNTGTNINLEKLDPRAELVSGWGPLNSMVEGVDQTFGSVFLIGYHARATTLGGTLAHTWSGNVLDLSINGQIIGEVGWAALFAGHFGVPIGLVTGDDQLLAQVRHEIPEGVCTVMTKTGWAFNCAKQRPMIQVRDEIRTAARQAVTVSPRLACYRPTFPITLRIRFRHWERLSICEAVPGVRRVDAQTVEATAADAMEAQKYFVTLHRLARPS